MGPDALDALELGYGISKAGATLAPINPNFTEPEAVVRARDAAPAPGRRRTPTFRGRRRAVAEPLGAPDRRDARRPDGGRGARRARRRGSGRARTPSDVFLTSGSTGVSKGAMLSHRAAWLRAIQRDNEDGATRRRGAVVMFGLFHMAGWSMIEDAWAPTGRCTS